MSYFESTINPPITDGTINAYSLNFVPQLYTYMMYMLADSTEVPIQAYAIDNAAFTTYQAYSPWRVLAFLNGIFNVDSISSPTTITVPSASTMADVYINISKNVTTTEFVVPTNPNLTVNNGVVDMTFIITFIEQIVNNFGGTE